MKKLLILILSTSLFTSCVSDYDRLVEVQKKYPTCLVSPSTSLLASQGYSVLVEDTANNKIYAVSFWTFSSKKIASIRNIK